MSYAYYRFFPGDYMRDTMHLGWLEDLAYRRLIDLYCLRGRPIKNDRQYIMRALRASEPEQQTAVDTILSEFFQLKADGWHQTRCNAEIKYREGLSGAGIAGAKARWNKKIDATALPSQCVANANQNQNQNQNQKKALIPPNPLNAQTWECYAGAYAFRYGTAPVRNAKTNSCISNIVKRLGSDAPEVASFYLTHNDQWYVKKRHPVDSFLGDCEGLRTQWKTGRKSTGLEARSAEQKDAVVEQIKRVTENLERKDREKKSVN